MNHARFSAPGLRLPGLAWLPCVVTLGLILVSPAAIAAAPPNIILVMADDMGWGQTGYYDHPRLKTPHLDAMAGNGLRFDRFYAAAPVCSPTRASVMTGRTNDRTGVRTHGYALRLQEETLAQILQRGGYATGHFGKWHLNGLRGPGVPVLASDPRGPGVFGFDEWLSVTNFFDRDPVLSRRGKFEPHQGDSSEVVIDEALKFARKQTANNHPFFAVVWFGTPHSPFVADEADAATFADLDDKSKQHYGELVAMDRSIGTLRRGLRDLQISDDTLVWFCSDNGGLPGIKPQTAGGLRGNKGSVYEGGLRVPAVIEWPAGIAAAQTSRTPVGAVDIFPTLIEIVSETTQVGPQHDVPRDGASLAGLIRGEPLTRRQPLGFRYNDSAAWISGTNKLVAKSIQRNKYELYDLAVDPAEQHDLASEQPIRLKKMIRSFTRWNTSVQASFDGHDYPEGKVSPADPEPIHWTDAGIYDEYFDQFRSRPEYGDWLKKRGK